jgi:hypothetical protein
MAIHFRSIERRRTARAAMCMNVLAYGETPDGEKFRFWTRTTSVSGHGGALELETALVEGQIIELMNEYNLKKATAKIVSVRRGKKGPASAAFEFVSGGESFWSMAFPAAKAKPLRRFFARPGEAN